MGVEIDLLMVQGDFVQALRVLGEDGLLLPVKCGGFSQNS